MNRSRWSLTWNCRPGAEFLFLAQIKRAPFVIYANGARSFLRIANCAARFLFRAVLAFLLLFRKEIERERERIAPILPRMVAVADA